MSALRRWAGRLVLSFQFLTRIPIPLAVSYEGVDFAGSMIFFPIVGLFIGMLMAGGFLLGQWLGGAALGAALALLMEFWVTGGLHIDGMADLWDALYSGKDTERQLEIMKDSRVGTFGVLGVLFSQGMRWAGMYALALSGRAVWPLLLALPVLGRVGVVFTAAGGRYARPTGTGQHFIALTGWGHFAGTVLVACALLLPILGLAQTGLYLCGAAVTAGVFLLRMTRRFGGVTGDMLGASGEFCEITGLLLMLLWGRLLM